MTNDCVIALGFFDSIHSGHRYLLNKGITLAKELGSEFCLFTFDDDFLCALQRNDEEVFLLSERKFILNNFGINNINVLPSNYEFMQMSKETFLQYLSNFSPKAIIVGKDYKFGKNAEGNVNDICQFFTKNGTIVEICDLLEFENKKISTTRIKELLRSGDIAMANALLENRFFYCGKIIAGHQNGKKMGLPTINIEIAPQKIKIKEGVYVTYSYVCGKRYLSVSNVGGHPTFSDNHFNVETHILDAVGDIYGQEARIEFICFIREIKKFSSTEKLAEQIKNDIIFARSETKND